MKNIETKFMCLKSLGIITLVITFVLLNMGFAIASTEYSDDEVLVVVTPTGECYHSKTCEWVGEYYRTITLAQAKEEGFRDCKVCKVFGPDMEVVPQKAIDDATFSVLLVLMLSVGAVLMAITKHNERKTKEKEELAKEEEKNIQKRKREQQINRLLTAVRNAICEIEGIFVDENRFIFDSEVEDLRTKWNNLYLESNHIERAYRYDKDVIKFRDLYGNISELTSMHNEEAREKIIAEARRLVNPVEGCYLDEQQLGSIAIPAKNYLVIAGAGTGKTTTIVGYIKYLLLSKKCKPEEILALSFTNSSAKELSERVQKETNEALSISTFHKLGINIINSGRDDADKISTYYTKTSTFIREKIKQLSDNPKYSAKLLEYVLYFANADISPSDFKDRQTYELFRKSHPPVSFKKEELKSNGEVDIANFLFLNGVDYIYEMPYKHRTSGDGQFRQYCPDFFLPKYDIYIEYFGIDESGNVPKSWDDKDGVSAKKRYNDSIVWKRELHQSHKTTMLETFAYEKRNGTLISSLKKQLEVAGVKLEPKSEEEMWAVIGGTKAQCEEKVAQIILSVINLMKSNSYSLEDMREMNATQGENTSISLLLSLVEPIYLSYQNMLEATGAIDFNDMISIATQIVEEGKYMHSYKYVLIDEYQDISKARYRLIKALRDSKDFSLFCVGDDWQSIYRFAGSDINFILDFENYWGKTETSYIEKTYRFPQSLCNVSGQFVMKNQRQMRKNIVGKRDNRSFSLETIVADTGKEYIESLTGLLKSLPEESTVFLLGRYTFDINIIAQNTRFSVHYDSNTREKKVVFKDKPKLSIRFMTIHESKGAQADYVVIINNRSENFGFPSTILEPPIMKLLLEKEEEYPFAEERRLFYVAMTRARKKVWLLFSEENKSIFVQEIVEEHKINLINQRGKCIVCGGKLLATDDKSVLMCSDCNHKQYLYEKKKCPLCGGKLKTRSYRSNEVLGCENYFSVNKCYYLEDPTTGKRIFPNSNGGPATNRNIKNASESSDYRLCEEVIASLPLCPKCKTANEVAKGLTGPFVRCKNPFCKFMIPNDKLKDFS